LRPGRISIITHPSQFVKRKVAQISNNYFSHNCAILPVDFCGLSAIISSVKGRCGEPANPKGEKNLENFQENPLTNRTECAIMNVSRGEGNRNQAWQWWNRNPQKNLLTNSTRCAIMSMSRGELPKTKARHSGQQKHHELKLQVSIDSQ
jgi:hypothetical protein